MATEYISKSWQIYKKNFLTFIAAELISVILPGLLILLGLVIFLVALLPQVNLSTIATANETVLSNYFLELSNNPKFVKSALFGGIGFGLLFFISLLLSLYFGIGKMGLAYESLTKKAKLRTMFKVSRKLGLRWIFTSFLIFVLIIFALGLMGIFGILTLGMGIFIDLIVVILIIPVLNLIGPAIVVDNSFLISSIKRAFSVAKRNYLDLFGLFLFYIIINFLLIFLGISVSFIPLIGNFIDFLIRAFIMFVITPMISISFVSYYVNNRKGKALE